MSRSKHKAEWILSPSIEFAVKRWPALKNTIKQAKKQGVVIHRHFVKYTCSGAVYQHLFQIVEGDTLTCITNQNLLNRCKVFEQCAKDLEEKRADLTPKTWSVDLYNEEHIVTETFQLQQPVSYVEAESKASELKQISQASYATVLEIRN